MRLPTTARAVAADISISGPLAKASGPVHGSSTLIFSRGDEARPVAVQLRQPFLRLVRAAPAEYPKPVDISVRVRHEYHSKTPLRSHTHTREHESERGGAGSQ